MDETNNQNLFDLIIIGAGAAGLSAAIYAARKKLDTVVIAKEVGGQALLANKIENYPGIKSIKGADLISLIGEQVKDYGIKVVGGVEIKQIKQDGNVFKVMTSGTTYLTKTVLIASGKTPKRLNVPGEKELEGKGISFCSICDAPLYKGKDVAVVGGGNAGFDAALDLTKYSNKIYVLEYSDKLLGDELIGEKLKKSKKVTFVLNAATKKIKGKETVEGLIYEDRKTGEQKELEVGGVFVSIGQIPSTDFVKNLVKLDEENEIIINPNTNATNVPGIFAAGDVSNIVFKQCVISVSEGAKAALNAYKYLQNLPES